MLFSIEILYILNPRFLVISFNVFEKTANRTTTLWCQLEDMFQLIDTPTKVYAIGARFFIKGAPRSASKLGIDPINSHASYFGKSTGSNKRSVPINRTVSSNWHQRVSRFPNSVV